MTQPINTVLQIEGLVAFWTFGEKAGHPRCSVGTDDPYPLRERNGPVERISGGNFSGYSARLDGHSYFGIPRAEIGNLDICGSRAQVTIFSCVKLEELNKGVTIAGVWREGGGPHDDSGARQYAALIHMPLYGGARQFTPHVSGVGGYSRRLDGSGLPWCVDYAATRSNVPVGEWVTLSFTYDGYFIRAYFNGVMEEREIDPEKDGRSDPYFMKEGPQGESRGMNPYYYDKGIFCYDPITHAKSKPGGGADFTVGAREVRGKVGEAMQGCISGLAVFNRALSEAEIQLLHSAANEC